MRLVQNIFGLVFVSLIAQSSSIEAPWDSLLTVGINVGSEIVRFYELITGKDTFNTWLAKRDPKQPFPKPEYDFIVVGAGSAGSVIANRLSEIKKWNILLIEAGKPEHLAMHPPLFAPAFQHTTYDWQYLMEKEAGIGHGLRGKRMLWPRGKALGGTSAINYMIYTRGNRIDFDRWGANNTGWSYDDVLCYYKKSERANIDHSDPRYHRKDGYQGVENIFKSPIIDAMIQGGQELGYPYADYNAPTQSFVVDSIQATVLKGARHSVANAFLFPVKDRPNLDIITSAEVTRLLIDPQTKETKGVEMVKDGRKYTIKAGKEVILSAGAFNSPKLLMLAGIGPKDHLTELGIPVLEDRPVGRNLHDHLTFPGLAFFINESVALSPFTVLTVPTFRDYLLYGTNRLTSLGGVEGIAYVKTEVSKEVEDYPDIELLFVDGTLVSDLGVTRLRMRISDDVYNGLFLPTLLKPQWTMFPLLLHPKSIGYMKLRSKNPEDSPIFHGNFFTEYEDIKTFIASIRIIQKFAKTTALQGFQSTMSKNVHPGCQHWEFDSDSYWECCLRSISVTLHHQVGTAKMGPKGDPTAVVDNELKVHGIKGLRVSDCSIIPFALSAHTNAPAIMVGEKTADIIKRNWGELDAPCNY